jgi:hypothetical protein
MSTDILYQNNDVCILDPASERGILIFTRSKSKNICSEGLLSYNELRKRHPELNLKNRHHHDPTHDDLIFFRAPYNSDTSSFESSYDGKPVESMLSTLNEEAFAILRIDPEKTYVYSSETRAKGKYSDLIASRIPMSDYLNRIRGHSSFRAQYPSKPCANILTFEKRIFGQYAYCSYPWEEYLPIERMAEVVVKLPHIPPEWFVKCVTNTIKKANARFGGKRRMRKTLKIKKNRKLTRKYK